MAWNAGSDLIKGNDMFLYIVDLNGSAMTSGSVSSAKVLAYATSCSLEINADTLDTTSKLSCRWNSNLPGNASYTVNSDCLYCLKANAAANGAFTIDDLFDQMVQGENVGWVMGVDSSDTCGQVSGVDTTKPYYWGTASISSLSISAGNNEIVSSSISLQGDGKPEQHLPA